MTNSAPKLIVRDVTDADMTTIQQIYAYHVLNGAGSFEETPPTVEEMIRMRDDILAKGFPYRVAVVEGRVAGYAYASAYRPRPAYRYTVENSVYVSQSSTRMGCGSQLLAELIVRCTDLGYRQMIAVIGDTGNAPSIGLHKRMGFTQAGVVKSVGFKLGRWVDGVIMQLALGQGDETLP